MKAIGSVRKIDEFGRVVIPKDLRKSFDLEEGDSVEVFTEGDSIILRKYMPFCVFCGSSEDLTPYEGKNICSSCIKKIQKISE